MKFIPDSVAIILLVAKLGFKSEGPFQALGHVCSSGSSSARRVQHHESGYPLMSPLSALNRPSWLLSTTQRTSDRVLKPFVFGYCLYSDRK